MIEHVSYIRFMKADSDVFLYLVLLAGNTLYVPSLVWDTNYVCNRLCLTVMECFLCNFIRETIGPVYLDWSSEVKHHSQISFFLFFFSILKNNILLVSSFSVTNMWKCHKIVSLPDKCMCITASSPKDLLIE